MKKKILIIISLILVLITLSACGGENYWFGDLPLPGGPDIKDEIKDGKNSGVVVQKGDYVYMINGAVSYNIDNKFGVPEKGAIYRLKLDENGNVIEGETRRLAPKAFYSSIAGAGLYIPDNQDKLFYLSPSTSKDKQGNTLSTYTDIFCVNLNGTNTKKLATVRYINDFKFIEINSKIYFVYSYLNSEQEGSYYETRAIDESGKEFKIVSEYEKALLGDDNYIYYTKSVSKDEGKEEESKITGDENFNRVYRKAIIDGIDDDELKFSNGKNISQNEYKVDLVEFKDGVLYYTKNIPADSTQKNLYFAYKGGVEYQLNYSETLIKPYFLGFDGSDYLGTIFFDGSSKLVLAEADNVKAPDTITTLSGEPQYLFMENDALYFMDSGKMYSVEIFNKSKTNLSDFKITMNLERYYPQKIGNYIYFIGIDPDAEYNSKYLYRHDITKEDLEADYAPERLGELSTADKELKEEAEEDK